MCSASLPHIRGWDMGHWAGWRGPREVRTLQVQEQGCALGAWRRETPGRHLLGPAAAFRRGGAACAAAPDVTRLPAPPHRGGSPGLSRQERSRQGLGKPRDQPWLQAPRVRGCGARLRREGSPAPALGLTGRPPVLSHRGRDPAEAVAHSQEGGKRTKTVRC